MTKTDEKIYYDPKVITRKEVIENPFDPNKIPVYTIENCEVLFSSLGVATPQNGHGIRVLLPADTNFKDLDRKFRNNLLLAIQESDPNLESINSAVKVITQKNVLEGKFPSNLLNRCYMTFNITNAGMFDEFVDENGETKRNSISNSNLAKGKVTVNYFRAVDKWTGEGINPEVFKYENGEKVKSFINPKTKTETPLYVGKSDIVNIKIRPYRFVDKRDGANTLKYNLLSVEQVRTAYEMGGGKTSKSKVVREKSDVFSESDLKSIFAGITNDSATVQATQQQTVVQEQAPVATPEPTPMAVVTPIPVAQEVQPTSITNEVPQIDFSALANLNIGNANLGE